VPFDIVCIDPPYLKGLLEPVLNELPVCPMFHAETIFIIERQKRDNLGFETKPALEQTDERLFGDTVLTFFRLRRITETAPASSDGAGSSSEASGNKIP